MTANMSPEMIKAVVSALRFELKHFGLQSYDDGADYEVTNEEALEFFEELAELEKVVVSDRRDGGGKTEQAE